MRGLPMTLDGQFVGFVGDAVSVTPVSHALSVELPSGLKATYDIVAQNGRISATSVIESRCVGTTSWSVGSQSAPTVQEDEDGPSVKLPQPGVAFEGMCPLDLPNLACVWRQVELQIHSTPEVGAEIWIDGVQLRGATSRQVNVGYCGGTAPSVVLLLRKAGYSTCQASVEIEDRRSEYDVGCALRKL
jgi:hypothetical protein